MVHTVSSACVPIEFMVMGPIDNNVYIIDDGAGCLVVDPSCEADRILEALNGRKLDAIFITHCHWDHTGAAAELREATGAPVIASKVDAPYITGEDSLDGRELLSTPSPVDRLVDEGDVVEVGNMKWKVLATPGHTPGGICFFLESNGEGAPVLISGDTLFAGTHGRVDLPKGNIEDMRVSLVRLSELPPETIVLPGHNGLSTIGREQGWLRICR